MASSFLSPRSLSSFCLLFCLAALSLSSLAAANPIPVTTVSAASFEIGPVAPESLAAAFGAKLATVAATATDVDPQLPGVQLPTQLAGTTVRVNDQVAQLLFVSDLQVNFLVPTNLPVGYATVTIQAADGTVSTGTVLIRKVAPALFTANADGQGALAANVVRVRNGVRLPDEGLVEFDPTTKRYVTKPLELGPETDRVFLEIFGTGMRGAEDKNGDGNWQESVWVLAGGQVLTPTFAGRQGSFAGLDQVNVEIPRSLNGAGKLNLAVMAQRTISKLEGIEKFTSPLVGLEIATTALALAPKVADFSPATVQAGQAIIINGSNFALNANDNAVNIGGAFASVESATATRLLVRVPFGAASAKVVVKTPQGEGASADKLSVKTSISGYVTLQELRTFTLRDVVVRLVGTNLTAKTNDEGVFQLTDVPVGNAVLEVDANVASLTNAFPLTRIALVAQAGRDNLLPAGITISANAGITSKFNKPLLFGWGEMTFTPGAIVQFAGAASSDTLQVYENIGLPVPRETLPHLPALPLHAQAYRSFLFSPYDGTLSVPATVSFGVDPTGQVRLYYYEQSPGSTNQGKLVAVEGRLGSRGNTTEFSITKTGFYASYYIQTDVLDAVAVDPAIIGTVLEPGTNWPLRNAVVTGFEDLSTFALTDERGSFILRKNLPFVFASYLRPDATVARLRGEFGINPGDTTAPVKIIPTTDDSLPGKEPFIGLLRDNLRMAINEQRTEHFVVVPAAHSQVQSVSVSGAPFVSLLRETNGIYRLQINPTAKDSGAYKIIVTATDQNGASHLRLLNLAVTAPNAAPVISIPQAAYRIKAGETLTIPVTGTDADAGQKVGLIYSTPASGGEQSFPTVDPGNPTTQTFTWKTTADSAGLYTILFVAYDDYFEPASTTTAVSVQVDAAPKANEWSLVSNSFTQGIGAIIVTGNQISISSLFINDAAITWQSVQSPVGLPAGVGTTFQQIGSRTFAPAFGNGLYVSSDNGKNWAKIGGGLQISANEYVSPVVGSDAALFVEVGSTLANRIYTSTDQGQTWSVFRTYPTAQSVLAGDTKGHVLVRDLDGKIYQVTANGATIKLTATNLPPSSDLKWIAPIGTKLYLTVNRPDSPDDFIYASSDSGVQWANVTAQFPAGDYRSLVEVGARVYALVNYRLLVSRDSAVTWTALPVLPGEVNSFGANEKYIVANSRAGGTYIMSVP